MTYPSPPPSYYPQPPMPGYGPPMGYYNPMAQPPLPGSIKALGIIGIVLASIGLLNNGVGVGITAWAMNSASARQLIDAPSERVVVINLAFSAVCLGLAIYLLICAIGALRLRPWARGGLRTWAMLYLVCDLAWAVVSYIWLLPESVAAQRAKAGGTLVPGYEVGMYGGATVVFIIMSIYPILVLIWMGKPQIKAAFTGEPIAGAYPGAAPAGYGWPPQGYQAQGYAPQGYAGHGYPAPGAIPPPGQYPPPPSPR